MGMIDMDDEHRAVPLGIETREWLALLNSLWFFHLNGPGPHQRRIGRWRAAVLLGGCLAVSAVSVAFAQYIPPSLGFGVFGFLGGILVSGGREQVVFRRIWPFYEAIIDWKHVDKARRGPDGSGEGAS